MANILIAYFSRRGKNYVNGSIKNLPVGNTEIAANMAAELTGGDLFHIQPTQPYSDDYHACVDEARKELSEDARPEIIGRVDNMDSYDMVILMYPNWCGTMPMPVWTFLDSYDFGGKLILPLCTNEGSGMGSSEIDLKRLCPTANIGMGLSVHGASVKTARGEITRWIEAVER